jgi:hypothetical protein
VDEHPDAVAALALADAARPRWAAIAGLAVTGVLLAAGAPAARRDSAAPVPGHGRQQPGQRAVAGAGHIGRADEVSAR